MRGSLDLYISLWPGGDVSRAFYEKVGVANTGAGHDLESLTFDDSKLVEMLKLPAGCTVPVDLERTISYYIGRYYKLERPAHDPR